MNIIGFSDATPFSLVDIYQTFERICCLHLQGGSLQTVVERFPCVSGAFPITYQITRCHKKAIYFRISLVDRSILAGMKVLRTRDYEELCLMACNAV
jgi:hypothetical protein